MPENPCEVLLKDGLYARLSVQNTGNFHYDFKRYFESNEFKEDVKSGKINFAFEVTDPIELISNALDFGASEDEVNRFQQWVRERQSIELKSSFFKSFINADPDEALAREYVNCLKTVMEQKGFSTLISRDQNVVSIRIFYNKISATDPDPKVENFDLNNCTFISKSFEIGKNLDITNSVVLKIIDETKPAVFSLDTDKGSLPMIIPSGKSKKTADFPVGTIITSFLTWKEFEKATENNKVSDGVWESGSCHWSPCDGRKVPNSYYQEITGETNVPELRGLFLRGLNTFDADSELGGKIPKVSVHYQDPDNRTRGSFQEDEFKEHSHGYWRNYSPNNAASGQGLPLTNQAARTERMENEGGSETRPKNAAVYYYIRIN